MVRRRRRPHYPTTPPPLSPSVALYRPLSPHPTYFHRFPLTIYSYCSHRILLPLSPHPTHYLPLRFPLTIYSYCSRRILLPLFVGSGLYFCCCSCLCCTLWLAPKPNARDVPTAPTGSEPPTPVATDRRATLTLTVT